MVELLIAILGGVLTYFGALRFDVIRASAGVSLLFYLLLKGISIFYEVPVEAWSTIFYGGSFVGMSSSERTTPLMVAMACGIFIVFYTNMAVLLNGMGGALGLGAFLSVLCVLVAKSAIFKAWALFKS